MEGETFQRIKSSEFRTPIFKKTECKFGEKCLRINKGCQFFHKQNNDLFRKRREKEQKHPKSCQDYIFQFNKYHKDRNIKLKPMILEDADQFLYNPGREKDMKYEINLINQTEDVNNIQAGSKNMRNLLKQINKINLKINTDYEKNSRATIYQARPAALTKDNLTMISKHRDHYLITHKSVGVRYLLIIMENGKVYLQGRNQKFYDVVNNIPNAHQEFQDIIYCFDCELILEQIDQGIESDNSDKSPPPQLYIPKCEIFDCIICSGHEVFYQDYGKRLQHVQNFLNNVSFKMKRLFPFELIGKQYVNMSQIDILRREIIPSLGFPTEGFIFSRSSNAPYKIGYYNHSLFKWQPADQISLDFLIRVKNIDYRKFSDINLNTEEKLYPIELYIRGDEKSLVFFDFSFVNERIYKDIKYFFKNENGELIAQFVFGNLDEFSVEQQDFVLQINKHLRNSIGFEEYQKLTLLTKQYAENDNYIDKCKQMFNEMGYFYKGNNFQGFWKFDKFRMDKISPNYFQGVISNMKVIQDSIEEEYIMKLKRPIFIKELSTNKAIQSHEGKLANLKKFYNFIKTVIIKEGFKIKEQRQTELNLENKITSVMDIGVGKGGDLNKWKMQEVDFFLGIDPNKQFLEATMKRVSVLENNQNNKKKSKYLFMQGEGSVDKELFVRNLPDNLKYDFISCQFVIQFMFDKQRHAENLFKNIADNLSDNGVALFTYPDEQSVEKYRKESREKFENEFIYDQNKHFQFQFDNPTPPSNNNNGYGQSYGFYMEEISVGVRQYNGKIQFEKEYEIKQDVFDKLADRNGLKIVTSKNFVEFYQDIKEDYLDFQAKVGAQSIEDMSQDVQEIIGINRMALLVKKDGNLSNQQINEEQIQELLKKLKPCEMKWQ